MATPLPMPSLDAFTLSIYPRGTRIVAAQSYRPGYLEYPMRVGVLTPEGLTRWCVIKRGGERERVEREAGVLGALKELGLAVPTVLAGPTDVADHQDVRPRSC